MLPLKLRLTDDEADDLFKCGEGMTGPRGGRRTAICGPTMPMGAEHSVCVPALATEPTDPMVIVCVPVWEPRH